MVNALEAFGDVGIQDPFGFLVDENMERPGRKP
jgi:hypothetical protein